MSKVAMVKVMDELVDNIKKQARNMNKAAIVKVVDNIEKQARNMNKAAIVKVLDELADNIEKQSKQAALAIDKISDKIEKRAYFNQAIWLPGRSTRAYPNFSKMPRYQKSALYICISCNLRRYMMAGSRCPRCGHSMRRSA